MRLAVVIPSGPQLSLLANCLASIRAASCECEVIVVADSPADTESIAARFPSVRVVRVPRRGFAASANAGIAATTADVVQLLNDDTEVEPNWADAALQAFRDAEVGSVAPLILRLETRRTSRIEMDSAGDDYNPGGFARKRGRGETWPHQQFAEAESAWGANATAGFYRRAALIQVGGFAEDFGSYFEDVDLAHRLNRAGWRCRYEPASIVWHAIHGSYGAWPNRAVLRMQSRNEERVFWRNTPRGELATRLPRHLVVLAAKALRRINEGEAEPWLAGRIAAWLGEASGRRTLTG